MHQNFFEESGLSKFERFHSQMFCWLINNSSIDKAVKIKIINKLFNHNINMQCKYIECIPEYTIASNKRVDLLLNVDEISFVIENKLRSSQYDNQLAVYKKELDKKISESNKTDNKQDKYFFYYLTLIDEKAEADGWNNITYENFLNTLEEYKKEIILSFDKCECTNSKIIYLEYVNSIKHLVETINDFKKSFVNYPSIFKNDYPCDDKYPKEDFAISQNLETILQKQFYHIVASKMSNNNYIIKETHGFALLEFDISEIFYEYNKLYYKIGIQIQSDCIKLFFRPSDIDKYKSSSIDDIHHTTITLFRKFAANIRKKGIEADEKKLLSISRFNKKSKAFISISFKRNKSIISLETYDNAIKCFQEEYNIVEAYAKDLINEMLKSPNYSTS